MKKVQTFLRYPFSAVKFGESNQWLEQIEQDSELTLH